MYDGLQLSRMNKPRNGTVPTDSCDKPEVKNLRKYIYG